MQVYIHARVYIQPIHVNNSCIYQHAASVYWRGIAHGIALLLARKTRLLNIAHCYLNRIGHCVQQRYCRSASADLVAIGFVALARTALLTLRCVCSNRCLMECILASTAPHTVSSETSAKEVTGLSEPAMQARRAGAIICKSNVHTQQNATRACKVDTERRSSSRSISNSSGS